MTPTDVARQLLAIRSDGNYDDFAKRHAGTIARALLDAEERIAALEKSKTECLRFLEKIRIDERIFCSSDAWDEINDFVARLELLRKAKENDL